MSSRPHALPVQPCVSIDSLSAKGELVACNVACSAMVPNRSRSLE